jgi:hypothetical protein
MYKDKYIKYKIKYNTLRNNILYGGLDPNNDSHPKDYYKKYMEYFKTQLTELKNQKEIEFRDFMNGLKQDLENKKQEIEQQLEQPELN